MIKNITECELTFTHLIKTIKENVIIAVELIICIISILFNALQKKFRLISKYKYIGVHNVHSYSNGHKNIN